MAESYVWPLTDAENEQVTAGVDKMIVQLWRDTEAAFLDEVPGVHWPKGREELAFYRTTDQAWWERLAAPYPGRAQFLARRWMALQRRYG